MNVPLVSICVPTYNRARFLETSLKTIQAQNYPAMEIIVGDNASMDATQDLCSRLAQSDSRIRYIRRDKNIGIYPNHNALIEESRGEYICFLHDDDEFSPQLISREVSFLFAHPTVGIVAPNWRLIDEEGEECGVRRHRVPPVEKGIQYIDRTLRSGRSTIGLSGTMIRRSTLGEFRFNEKGPIGFGDFVLWFQLAECSDVGHVRHILYSYRLHSHSLSRKSILSVTRDYGQALYGYCNEHLERWPPHKNLVTKWREDIRRYLFWSLAYEVILHYSRIHRTSSVRSGYRTMFDRMEYLLDDKELQEVMHQLKSLCSSPREHLVVKGIEVMVRKKWTWLLGRLAPYAPSVRGLLGFS